MTKSPVPPDPTPPLPASDHARACPHCGQLNEPPFLFCVHCHGALAELGRWRVTLNLGLAFAVFSGMYLAGDLFGGDWLAWAWPVYLFLALLLVQVGLWLVRGVPGQAGLLLRWLIPTLALGGAYFQYRQAEGEGVVFYALAQLPELAGDFPMIFWPAAAALLVAIMLPATMRWAAQYGWVLAYRIALLTLVLGAMLGIAALREAAWLERQNVLPALTADLAPLIAVRPAYDKALGLGAIMLGRLLLAEIFIFATLRGYGLAHKARIPAARRAENATGFERALIGLAVHVRRFLLILENMFQYLLVTLRLLMIDMAGVLKVIAREVAAPLLTMTALGWLLYLATLATDRYIQTGSLAQAGLIALGLAGMLTMLNAFLAAKTPIRWERLIRHQGQLLGWLLPNLMLFFLLISLTLAASASVLTDTTDERLLPYRIGPLTIAVAAILAVLLVVTLYRRRALFTPEEAAEEEPEPIAAPVETEPAPGLVGRAMDSVRQVELPEPAKGLGRLGRSAFKGISERLEGRPPILAKLDQARQRLVAKLDQVRGLERLRATLDPETHYQLRVQYRNELPDLIAEHEELLSQTRRQMAARSEELLTHEEALRGLERQSREIDTLESAGVLKKPEALRRRKQLKKDEAATREKIEPVRRIVQIYRESIERSETTATEETP